MMLGHASRAPVASEAGAGNAGREDASEQGILANLALIHPVVWTVCSDWGASMIAYSSLEK